MIPTSPGVIYRRIPHKITSAIESQQHSALYLQSTQIDPIIIAVIIIRYHYQQQRAVAVVAAVSSCVGAVLWDKLTWLVAIGKGALS